jgi:hypothetical protein
MSFTEENKGALRFVAAQECAVPAQVAEVAGWGPEEVQQRLDALAADGSLTSHRWAPGRPALYRVSASAQTDLSRWLSDLEPLVPARISQWLAVGWLWIAASGGGLGDLRAVLSRREMIAAGSSGRAVELFGPGQADVFSRGTDDVGAGYPDLALVPTREPGWIAAELILSSQALRESEASLVRLEANRSVLAVLVIARGEKLVEDARAFVAGLGLGKVQVRGMTPGIPDGSSTGL